MPHLKNLSEKLDMFKSYYVYQGSQTQPPCHQGLTWLVNADVIYDVTPEQLESLKQLRDIYNQPMGNTARDLQTVV